MEYRELVADARQALIGLKRHRARLIADTVEAIDEHHKTHEQWADDIGAGQSTVGYWYRYAKDRQDLTILDEDPGDYGDWLKEQPGQKYGGYASPTERAEVVQRWLADDQGGRTRAEVGRVLHQHDTDTEQHLANTRQARVNEGQRPDFETTESVQRVLADYAQLEADSAKLPDTLSDRSKSLLSYRASHVLPTVQYHANLEHEHGLSNEEISAFFGGQS